MRPRIRKFVSREFAATVDLDLLRTFLEPFAEEIGFAWSKLSADDDAKREELYWLFERADERCPAEFHTSLFNIMLLSSRPGANLLADLADRAGVSLMPGEDMLGPHDGRYANPRYLALRSFLFHKDLFDQALKVAAFWSCTAPYELWGARPGVALDRHQDVAAAALETAVAEYFGKRYGARFCEVRAYEEGADIRILIQHGTRPETKTVEQDGRGRPLTFREITQDTVHYDSADGYLAIGTQSKRDAKKLVELLEEHLIGDPGFFSHSQSELLYTLDPVRESAGAFRFNSAWDDEVRHVRVTEVKVEEGSSSWSRRLSPWALLVRDRQNALHRLALLMPDLDLSAHKLSHAKFEFTLRIGGDDSTLVVTVTPPRTAAFREHAHERKVWEHLERNGIRCRPQIGASDLAAE